MLKNVNKKQTKIQYQYQPLIFFLAGRRRREHSLLKSFFKKNFLWILESTILGDDNVKSVEVEIPIIMSRLKILHTELI